MNLLVHLRSAFPSVIFCNLCIAIMSIFLARFIPVSLLGVWFLFLLVFSSLETINKLQHDTTFINFVGTKKIIFEECLITILFISVISTTIVLLVFYLFENKIILYLFKEHIGEGRFLVSSLILILPLNIIYFNYANFVLIKKKLGFYYLIQNVFWFTALISTIITVYYLDFGIKGALFSYFIIPQIVGLTICIISIHKNLRVNLNIKFSSIKLILNYSFQIYIFGLLTIYFLNSYRFIGSANITAESFAFFSLALVISNFITQPLPTALSTIILSKLSNTKSKNFNAMHANLSFKISFYLTIIFCIISYFIIKPLIIFFYGVGFENVFLIYIKVVIAYALINTSSIIATYFITLGKVKINIIINIIVCISITSLSFILIPTYGLNGIILTLMLSSIILFSLRTVIFFKINKIKIQMLFFNKDDLIKIKEIF